MSQAIDNIASAITLQSNGNSDRDVKSKALALIKEIGEFSKNEKAKLCFYISQEVSFAKLLIDMNNDIETCMEILKLQLSRLYIKYYCNCK